MRRLLVWAVAAGPALGIGAVTGMEPPAARLIAGFVLLLATLTGVVVLVGVVLPAVWSRQPWRRRAALTVLRELATPGHRGDSTHGGTR